MNAVVIHEYGGPSVLQYESVEDPVPGEGEVLVEASAASVNPIDWKMRSGEARERFPVEFPAILGRDVSGVVRALGPGVTGFQPGDQVMAFTSRTYAELVAVKAPELIKLPQGLDLVEAAALPVVLLSGEQLIRLGTKIEPGQSVLVTGALGSVGRVAVWVAKRAGAVVIAGVRTRQLQAAEELGADHLLALDDPEAVATFGSVDAVANTVGPETAQRVVGKVRPGGVFATVVTPIPDMAMHPTVQLVRIRAAADAEALGRLAADVAAGRLTIPIDRRVPLTQAAEAQIAAEKGGIGKVLLIP